MDDELLVIRTFINNFEAQLAHSALEAAGIESLIRADDCGGSRPLDVELLVRAEDAARAEEVLTTEPAALEPGPDETS